MMFIDVGVVSVTIALYILTVHQFGGGYSCTGSEKAVIIIVFRATGELGVLKCDEDDRASKWLRACSALSMALFSPLGVSLGLLGSLFPEAFSVAHQDFFAFSDALARVFPTYHPDSHAHFAPALAERRSKYCVCSLSNAPVVIDETALVAL